MSDRARTDYPEDRSLWRMVAAPTVWALHFAVCYAAAAIWCGRLGGDFADLRAVIAGVTVAALLAIGTLGWRAWVKWDFLDDGDHVHDRSTDEDRREFLGHTGFLLACLSAVGVLFVALPAFVIGSCA